MSPPPPELPTLPERFSAVEPLGRGSQATTVAAHDAKTGRAVAVKVLDLGQVRDWKAFERFERECTVMQSLSHPGIPTYLDHFRDEARGQYLLVMARAEGHTLAEDIARGRRRTEAQLLDLLEQLLDVLDYLHGLHPPLVHRDIKPSNVIIGSDGRITLVDFGGAAKVFRPDGASTVVGTFGYMAPEQMYGRATPGSDLYAVGATLAAVAAGEDAQDLPRQGLEVDLLAVMQPGVLRTVLGALLVADPDRRPASVAEVRRRLARARTDPSDAPELQAVALARQEERSLDSRPAAGPLLAWWRGLGLPQRYAAFGYLWVAVLLGVITRVAMLTVLLLSLFPVVVVLLRRSGHNG